MSPVRIPARTGHRCRAPPHVVTVRTPEERLVWYRALPARTTVALRDLGVLRDYRGYLVRDEYAAGTSSTNTPPGSSNA